MINGRKLINVESFFNEIEPDELLFSTDIGVTRFFEDQEENYSKTFWVVKNSKGEKIGKIVILSRPLVHWLIINIHPFNNNQDYIKVIELDFMHLAKDIPYVLFKALLAYLLQSLDDLNQYIVNNDETEDREHPPYP